MTNSPLNSNGAGQGAEYIAAIERVLQNFCQSSFDPAAVVAQTDTLNLLNDALGEWGQTARLPILYPGEFRPHMGEAVYSWRPPEALLSTGLYSEEWAQRQLSLRSNPIRRMLNALLMAHRVVIWDEIGLQLTAEPPGQFSPQNRAFIAGALERTHKLIPLIDSKLMLVESYYRMREVKHAFNPFPGEPYNKEKYDKHIDEYFRKMDEDPSAVSSFNSHFDKWINYRDHAQGRFDFFLEYPDDESELSSTFGFLGKNLGAAKEEARSTVRVLTSCGGLKGETLPLDTYTKIRANEEVFGDMRELLSKGCRTFATEEFPLKIDLYSEIQAEAGRYRGRLKRHMRLKSVWRNIIDSRSSIVIGGLVGAGTGYATASAEAGVVLAAVNAAGEIAKTVARGSNPNEAFRAQYMLFEE